MRELYRKMAKAKMEDAGYSKVNKRMGQNQWRRMAGAWPVSLKTGKKMSESFQGKKRQKKGSFGGLFVYSRRKAA